MPALLEHAAPRASGRLPTAIATSRCSVLTYSSFSRSASCSAASVTLRSRGESATCEPPCARGSRSSSARTAAATRGRVGVHLPDDLRDDAVPLLEEREQQVLGQDLRMAFAIGELLRREDRFLCFFGVLVDVHRRSAPGSALRTGSAYSFHLLPAPRSAARCSLRQRARQLHVHRRVQIAALVGLADLRHAVPLQPEDLRRSACPRESSAAPTPVIVGTCASPPSTAVVTGTATLRVQIVALAARTPGAAARARAGRDRRPRRRSRRLRLRRRRGRASRPSRRPGSARRRCAHGRLP